MLLEDGASEEDEPDNLLQDARRQRYVEHGNGGFSKWLRPLGFIFTVLFLFVILSRASSVLSRPPQVSSTLQTNKEGIDKSSPAKMLGIQLYPEKHVARPPTTLIHHWNITSGYRSPDGVRKLVYLVNEQFPGPTIECRSGDRLTIHVTNSLASEGVSIHWHGLEMRNANGMDGAVGFNQCPISPGSSFTYDFQIGDNQAGTFWWHAHSQVQRGDGMYGGLAVHKPSSMNDDRKLYEYGDDVLVMIGDWYHRSAKDVLAWYTSTRAFGNEVSCCIYCMDGN